MGQRMATRRARFCFLAVLLLAAVVAGCSDRNTSRGTNTPVPQLLPEIRTFLSQHPEFGEFVEAQDVPDWAQGKRQRVTLDASGSSQSLLFYTKAGKVVTVYRDGDSGRERVWGVYASYEPPKPVTKRASLGIPNYTVLFSVEKVGGGGTFGDVLIPALSPKTPATEREAVAKAICKKEAFTEVELYSTESAYKANMSASFLAAHPDALKKGYLGHFADGAFTP